MSLVIAAADREKLARPNVNRAFFGVFDLPQGLTRLHSGMGTKTVAGYEWQGVSDPDFGRMVSVGDIEEPRFGQAAKLEIILTAATLAFFKSVHATARQIEGRAASIYFGVFDPETEQLITQLIPLVSRGRMSAASTHWTALGTRHVRIVVENIWSAQNYPPGGRWSAAGLLQRNPGDMGGQFIGVEVSENWQ